MIRNKQSTNTIMMVRPSHFGYNLETAGNNKFQNVPEANTETSPGITAIQEFDQMVQVLREAGVNVLVFNDDESLMLPDSIFPNNWITTHSDGTIITYPMFAPVRRKERNIRIIEYLKQHFKVTDHMHLEYFEDSDVFLEGTGSMVLDRENEIIYACLSDRTHLSILESLSSTIGYELVDFEAFDQNGFPIYHTNVMMAVGSKIAIVCLDCIRNQDKERVLQKLKDTQKEIIDISMVQMMKFAGNMIELLDHYGNTILVMSKTSYHSLEDFQINLIKKITKLIPVEINYIETIGGGSARCMIAEIFLDPLQ